ncbi:MAG: hypothetical protein HRT44_10140, partial [Bdellovibrionales bacterium]|nr:hypothetical protein [Bdellovibrionales bacterium]NQZ19600.1 hypothetical protein [Bdellovibrionales bacterium]
MKFLVSTCLLTVLLLSVSCTEKSQNNNTHSVTPQQETPVEEAAVTSSMMESALRLENFRGVSMVYLREFFESFLTEAFFVKHSTEKDPEDQRAIIKFHLRFITDFNRYPDQAEPMKALAKDYYDRILGLCGGAFMECPYIGYLSRSVYAADVFLAAESLILPSDRPRFIEFVTNMGQPQNNPHIGQRRLDELVRQLTTNNEYPEEDLERLNNIVLFLSSKGVAVSQEAIDIFFLQAKNAPFNSQKREVFENLIEIVHQTEEDLSKHQGMIDEYIQTLISRSDFFEVISLTKENKLVYWNEDYPSYSANEDFLLVYVLLGLMNRKYDGVLHDIVTREFLSKDENREKLLMLVEAYLNKRFISNVYETHNRLGQRFQERLEEQAGQVEPILSDFFREADLEIAEIWLNLYRPSVNSLEEKLTRYYSGTELEKLSRISRKLELNLRNLVGYPIYFIVGYYASKQGNFNLPAITRRGAILERDESLYFHELFEGRFSQSLTSIPSTEGTAQDVLLGFYVSLDKNILDAYGLDLQFVMRLARLYLEPDRRFVVEQTTKVERFFDRNTVADEFKQRCDLINEGRTKDVQYDYSFNFVRQSYFLGQIAHSSTGGNSFGTTPDMYQYLMFYNTDDIATNLSNDLETIRVEMGPKLNRMKILQLAMDHQGLSEEVPELRAYLNGVMSRTKTLTQL